MAKKQRKSRVTREFPDSEATTKAVATATKKARVVKAKLDEAVKESADTLERHPPLSEKRKAGRPKATHGKIRFTTLLDPVLRDKMNLIRAITNKEVNEHFHKAVSSYIDQWQKDNSSIKLDDLLKR